ncbi:alginate lyase family protein [Zavarzinia sp. CC-PAN008]|uniref:alginate lyase family protein n=1 Tax=Zavarzinia sp. CC-PAN008 TaxID=3243332 RepID=UPI003F74ABC7
MRNAILLAVALMAFGALPARAAIQPPFAVADARQRYAEKPDDDFTCKAPPQPVMTLRMNSRYRPDVPGRADVDPAAERAYEEAMAPLRAYAKGLTKLANTYVRSQPSDPRLASCVLDWLDTWAAAGAMQGPASSQGEAARKWTLATLATSYLQVRAEPGLDPAKQARVLAWIRVLADTARHDYSTGTDRGSRNNNHLYWAAWGVGAASVVLDDRALFDWAMAGYRRGIEQVEADGTLPLEMARKQRALAYHVYAIGPLVMLAELAAANGVGLYGERDGALRRLVDVTLSGLDDPSLFAAKSGHAQDMDAAWSPGQMMWLIPYAGRFHDARALALIDKFRTVPSTRVGGDTRLLYGALLRMTAANDPRRQDDSGDDDAGDD